MIDIFAFRLFEAPEIAIEAGSWIVIVAFSICVHELAHAWVAYREGDDTAARAGHLSLNPLVQMGPMSLLLLLVIGIAWGAVPVDRARLRHRYSNAWVAFAGPLSNLILMALFAVFFVISLKVIPEPETLGQQAVLQIGELGVQLNLVLFIFNMLPVPILDGWHVYSYFIPAMERIDPARAQTICMMILFIVFMSPVLRFWLWAPGFLLTHLITGFVTGNL